MPLASSRIALNLALISSKHKRTLKAPKGNRVVRPNNTRAGVRRGLNAEAVCREQNSDNVHPVLIYLWKILIHELLLQFTY